jgi:transposase
MAYQSSVGCDLGGDQPTGYATSSTRFHTPEITITQIIAELEQKLRAQAADITRLEKQSQSLERKNDSLERKAQSLEAAKRELFEQLCLLIENRFGPSTEKYKVSQEDLFFDEAEALAESEPALDCDDVPEDKADTPGAWQAPHPRWPSGVASGATTSGYRPRRG